VRVSSTSPAGLVGVFPGSFDPLTVAHLAVAEAAVVHLGLDRIDLAISLSALGKEHLDDATVEGRVSAIEAVAARRPWLGVVVARARLVADLAQGYDAVVMGADKWAQVNDPQWYGGDVTARDTAVARLPRVAVAPRAGLGAPPELLLPVPGHLAAVSSTAVRAGRHEWRAAPEPGGTP
jgi:nicotinic acid mononucleotide adenylyltransferase